MPTIANVTIPYAALASTSPKEATLTIDQPMSVAVLSALMMSVIEGYVSAEAEGTACTLVSSTLDVTGDISAIASDVTIEANIDRKTRTIAFSGATATCAGKTVLTVTAVYKLASNA